MPVGENGLLERTFSIAGIARHNQNEPNSGPDFNSEVFTMRLICAVLFSCVLGLSSAQITTPTTSPATAPVEKEPHPARGVYAIWYQNGREHLLDLPFIKGGQVFAQWQTLEPEEGKYDFSSLEAQLKMLSEKKMKCTIQINGNDKPDWMFEKIPYWPKPMNQVLDARGTIMYWHPAFINAYMNFLKAYSQFLKDSPYKDAVLGVRMNYNAIGTEYISPREGGDELDKWIVPEGASREEMRVWTPAVGLEYQNLVFTAFIDNFLPDIYLFARAHMEYETREPYLDYFRKGRIGWFHTGSHPVEPANEWWVRVYKSFADYVKTGLTLGYAEPVADAWGYHGEKDNRSPMPVGPAQTNYWRLLVDLSYGIDFIACYGGDLDIAFNGKHRVEGQTMLQEEFIRAFEFAAKYAGYLRSPRQSPGAWIAMRQVEQKSADEAGMLTHDCEFLMKRLPDNSRGAKDVGPQDQRYSGWARILPSGQSMHFEIDPSFLASVQGKVVTVNLVYLDDQEGTMQLDAAGHVFPIPMMKSNRWIVASFEVPEANFETDPEGGQVVLTAGEKPLSVHMLEIERGQQ